MRILQRIGEAVALAKRERSLEWISAISNDFSLSLTPKERPIAVAYGHGAVIFYNRGYADSYLAEKAEAKGKVA